MTRRLPCPPSPSLTHVTFAFFFFSMCPHTRDVIVDQKYNTHLATALPATAEPTGAPSNSPSFSPTKRPTQEPTNVTVEQLLSVSSGTYVNTAISSNSSIYLIASYSGQQLLKSLDNGTSFSAVPGCLRTRGAAWP